MEFLNFDSIIFVLCSVILVFIEEGDRWSGEIFVLYGKHFAKNRYKKDHQRYLLKKMNRDLNIGGEYEFVNKNNRKSNHERN